VRRIAVNPRPDYRQKLEAQGLSYHARDDYWTEEVCYEFSLAEIEQVEAATAELHRLCIEAIGHVIENGRLKQLQIPEIYWTAIAASFQQDDFSLYGRLDLASDGTSEPKLLEYNADTPTSILETAVCQWFWLQDCFPQRDQFNSLHERLIARWQQLPGSGPVHLGYLADNEEDWVSVTYLMDTIVQANRGAMHLTMEDIAWDPEISTFVDTQGVPIETLFKLYPWEWMMREEFGPKILEGRTRFVEPIWKSVLSCKGLLPILWELFPDHPNLLPAYFEPGHLTEYAKKPLYSREGANVGLHSAHGTVQQADGPYGAEGHIFQALRLLPNFDGHYPVIGSWLVDGEPAGMGIREDPSPITTNISRFVPHYIL
jgi:glutathionylspermidine synthase